LGNNKLFHSPQGEDDQHAYHTSLEETLRHALTPFQEHIKNQTTASILLFICTFAALVWAGLPALKTNYSAFVNSPIGFHISSFFFEKSLRFWVNDVLLAFFFFFVGLEIKRELLVGELTDRKQALFVIIAALGGMLLPAGIYFLINLHSSTQSGWGIPMATDTAFALGILNCFKHKLPRGIFIFMAALAILDDIGSILVIAIFYSSNFKLGLFLGALLLSALILVINYAGIRRPWPYIIIGIMMWALIEASGVHGTLSGILLAFLIPSRPAKGPKQFLKQTKDLLSNFEQRKNKTPLVLKDQEQHAVLEEVQETAQQATTPLQRWEGKLERPIALGVLPLFALVNAGIPLNFHLLASLFYERVSLGILLGLVIGKPLGILLFSKLALHYRLGTLPQQIKFKHIATVSILSGIGFTMSLFIANLSFQAPGNTLLIAKAAILFSSVFSGIIGIIFLFMACRKGIFSS